MKNKFIGIAVVVVLAALAGSFYGGMLYGKSQASVNGRTRGQGGFQAAGRGGNRQSGQLMSGDILSKDEKSLTVRLTDGSSKIVYFSSSTSIGKTAAGTAADLEVGARVMIGGSVSDDGTVAAQTIQIRPAERATSTQK